MKVTIHSINEIEDELLAYAVIAAEYEGKWIYVRHRDRTTWEIPGGRREPGEIISDTASRELYEETGALRFELKPICAYGVDRDGNLSYGQLFQARIKSLGSLPESEIAEIRFFDTLPESLTYPLIQPILFRQVIAG